MTKNNSSNGGYKTYGSIDKDPVDIDVNETVTKKEVMTYVSNVLANVIAPLAEKLNRLERVTFDFLNYTTDKGIPVVDVAGEIGRAKFDAKELSEWIQADIAKRANETNDQNIAGKSKIVN